MTENLIEMNILFGGVGNDSHRKIGTATDPEREGKFKGQFGNNAFRVAVNQPIWKSAA
jgi:hypothetical protein